MSNCSDDSEEDDEEISALEYARLNGLSFDFLKDQSPNFHIESLQRATYDGLTSDYLLYQFEIPVNVRLDERLTVSKEAARLLSAVVEEPCPKSVESIILPMLFSKDVKNLRVETPLLKTDHEYDCREFAQKSDFEIKLEDIKLPLEIVDDEKCEGIGWPSKFSSLETEVLEKLRKEKLEIKRQTLTYFQNTLQNIWTEADEKQTQDRLQVYKRNAALEPVTPPLSPMPSQLLCYEPSMSSPGFQLPLFSDPASVTNNDLEALEKEVFDRDMPTPIRQAMARDIHKTSTESLFDNAAIKMGNIYSPLLSLDDNFAPPHVEGCRTKREDLKVEGPLTPRKSDTAIDKAVNFREMIEDLLLDPSKSPNSENFEASFFEEAFGEAVTIANRRLEQEQLIEADSTARVELPVMDFSLIAPPWANLQHHKNKDELPAVQKNVIKDIVGESLPIWPGTQQTIVKLRWNPFPYDLAKVALDEDLIQDGNSLEGFTSGPAHGDVINSSMLTWKPPGLRILRDDDHEDELECGQFEGRSPQDMSSLIKKRKLEIEEFVDYHSNVPELQAANVVLNESSNRSLDFKKKPRPTQTLVKLLAKPNDFISATQKLQLDSSMERGLLLGGPFSAGKAIDNFLELRCSRKQKPMTSSYFPIAIGLPQGPQIPPNKEVHAHSPVRKPPHVKADSIPAPEIILPTTKTYIIVSSTLLKRRGLIKNLEALYPSLTLIERDFTAHGATAWHPNSVTRSPIDSPLTLEADLVVSPKAGVVLTTLQKIKQKSLPGQKAKPAIRDRLERVSIKYEKLIILVSEGRDDDTTYGLDENDCLAFSEFAGFAAGLDSTVIVYFVGGGEETLSKWLASTIVNNRDVGEMHLLEEETHWELFLRRAGMNVFAAQAVIAALRAGTVVDTADPSQTAHFGLTAFIEMGQNGRIVKFGDLVGAKVLERVSAVVDKPWV